MNVAGDWMLHSMPVLLMLGMVGLNHLIMHHRTERRYALEASRLRAALISELRALQEIYRMNLELIESKANYLISARSPVLVYKGNLGRLTSLFDSPVIENLVSLFARNEIIEGLLAAHAIGKGGVSYQLTPETKLHELKQMYAAGADHAAWTCNALSHDDSDTGSSRSQTRLVVPQQTSIRAPLINRQPINA